MLDDPTFNAIWQVIKSWDVNVPGVYIGYMGATGNHARAILDAVQAVTTLPPPEPPPPTTPVEKGEAQ